MTGATRDSLNIDFNSCQGDPANNDLESKWNVVYGRDDERIKERLVGPTDNNQPSNCPATIAGAAELDAKYRND